MASKSEKGQQPPSQTRQRQDDKREKGRAELARQLEEGSLVIRKMTAKERAANPPQNRPPKRSSTK